MKCKTSSSSDYSLLSACQVAMKQLVFRYLGRNFETTVEGCMDLVLQCDQKAREEIHDNYVDIFSVVSTYLNMMLNLMLVEIAIAISASIKLTSYNLCIILTAHHQIFLLMIFRDCKDIENV